jgi:hypothetical protein
MKTNDPQPCEEEISGEQPSRCVRCVINRLRRCDGRIGRGADPRKVVVQLNSVLVERISGYEQGEVDEKQKLELQGGSI